MKYLKLILLAASITLVACEKDKEAENISSQETTINSYWDRVEVNGTTVFEKKVVDDIYRIVLQEGDKQGIAAGDTVSFYYTGAILTANGLETSNIFDTNKADVAKGLGLSNADQLKVCEDVVGEGRFIDGLDKGLLLMSKGETAQIIFTSKHGYGNDASSIIPKYSPIIFEITIADVKKQ